MDIRNKTCVLDHVALAVADLPGARGFYEGLGLAFAPGEEAVPSQGVAAAFAPAGGPARVELLDARGEGPVRRFLERRGPGLHHLCFLVPDVGALGRRLAARGVRLVYRDPVPGAGGRLVNFIHPSSAHGALVEIAQEPRAGAPGGAMGGASG